MENSKLLVWAIGVVALIAIVVGGLNSRDISDSDMAKIAQQNRAVAADSVKRAERAYDAVYNKAITDGKSADEAGKLAEQAKKQQLASK